MILILVVVIIVGWAIGIATWAAVAETCADIARRKGRNPDRWRVLGLVFGDLALLYLNQLPSTLPPGWSRPHDFVACPGCRMHVPRRTSCDSCGIYLHPRLPSVSPPPGPHLESAVDDENWHWTETPPS